MNVRWIALFCMAVAVSAMAKVPEVSGVAKTTVGGATTSSRIVLQFDKSSMRALLPVDALGRTLVFRGKLSGIGGAGRLKVATRDGIRGTLKVHVDLHVLRGSGRIRIPGKSVARVEFRAPLALPGSKLITEKLFFDATPVPIDPEEHGDPLPIAAAEPFVKRVMIWLIYFDERDGKVGSPYVEVTLSNGETDTFSDLLAYKDGEDFRVFWPPGWQSAKTGQKHLIWLQSAFTVVLNKNVETFFPYMLGSKLDVTKQRYSKLRFSPGK